MASNYPGSLDSFVAKSDGAGNPVNAAHINNLQNSIVAIETELGTDPAGSSADVKTRLGIQTKTYRALISQSLTNNPTAVVLENTLSGAIVWTRQAMGSYIGTLSGAFLISKTIVIPYGAFYHPAGWPADDDFMICCRRNSNDQITIETFTGSTSGAVDTLLNSLPLTIIVYP